MSWIQTIPSCAPPEELVYVGPIRFPATASANTMLAPLSMLPRDEPMSLSVVPGLVELAGNVIEPSPGPSTLVSVVVLTTVTGFSGVSENMDLGTGSAAYVLTFPKESVVLRAPVLSTQ